LPISGQQNSSYKFGNEYINLTSVTQGTWYTVADLSGDLCIYFANLLRKDDDAVAKQMSVRVTVDETWPVLSFNANNNAFYYICLDFADTAKHVSSTTSWLMFVCYTALFCNSFRLEVRWDGTVGSNPLLQSCVKYSRR